MATITNCGIKQRHCGRRFYYGYDHKWNLITKRDTYDKAMRMRKLDTKYAQYIDWGCL